MHILHDNTLTRDNREKFIYLAGRYGQIVKLYNVEELCADKIAEIVTLLPAVKTHWSTIGGTFKFLIADVLGKSVEKVIYLDSDIIVNLDIAELWHIDLGDKILGVVPEITNGRKGRDVRKQFLLIADGLVGAEDYFNTGVMLMNLKALLNESDNIRRGIRFRSENPQQKYLDQTIWNWCFSKRTVKLPTKFNRFVSSANEENPPTVERKMYHYVPKQMVMGMNTHDLFDRLWLDYFVKTPWFNVHTIGRLYENIRRLNVESKMSLVQLSAMMSGKTRAFVTLSQNLEATKQIFMIRDDEEIIFFDSSNSLPKIFDAMNQARGKKIFFIFLPGFPFQVLINEGFVYGRDFINGLEFLSEANGISLNSYPLLKSM